MSFGAGRAGINIKNKEVQQSKTFLVGMILN